MSSLLSQNASASSASTTPKVLEWRMVENHHKNNKKEKKEQMREQQKQRANYNNSAYNKKSNPTSTPTPVLQASFDIEKCDFPTLFNGGCANSTTGQTGPTTHIDTNTIPSFSKRIQQQQNEQQQQHKKDKHVSNDGDDADEPRYITPRVFKTFPVPLQMPHHWIYGRNWFGAKYNEYEKDYELHDLYYFEYEKKYVSADDDDNNNKADDDYGNNGGENDGGGVVGGVASAVAVACE